MNNINFENFLEIRNWLFENGFKYRTGEEPLSYDDILYSKVNPYYVRSNEDFYVNVSFYNWGLGKYLSPYLKCNLCLNIKTINHHKQHLQRFKKYNNKHTENIKELKKWLSDIYQDINRYEKLNEILLNE